LPAQGKDPDPAAMLSVIAPFGIMLLIIFFAIVAMQVLFIFIYPLIVEHHLSGVEAVKTSCRAGIANVGGLLGLILLNALLGIVGLLFCIVGVYFLLPITFGAHWMAYRQVFGEDESYNTVLAVAE
jgi:uncharacterized membrane protein